MKTGIINTLRSYRIRVRPSSAAQYAWTGLARLNRLFIKPKHRNAVIQNVASRIENTPMKTFGIWGTANCDLFKLSFDAACKKALTRPEDQQKSFASGLMLSVIDSNSQPFGKDIAGMISNHELLCKLAITEIDETYLNIPGDAARAKQILFCLFTRNPALKILFAAIFQKIK